LSYVSGRDFTSSRGGNFSAATTLWCVEKGFCFLEYLISYSKFTLSIALSSHMPLPQSEEGTGDEAVLGIPRPVALMWSRGSVAPELLRQQDFPAAFSPASCTYSSEKGLGRTRHSHLTQCHVWRGTNCVTS